MKAFSLSCLTVLTVSSILSSSAFADPKVYYGRKSRGSPYLTQSKTSMGLKAGIRQNNFDWNIASDITGTNTPNILSELTWDNVRIFEAELEAKHERPVNYGHFIRGGIVFDGRFKAGTAIDGDNQDSDYLGDNRTLEFSRSNNDGGTGYTVGGDVSIGHKFYLTSPSVTRNKRYNRRARRRHGRRASDGLVSVTPLIGYGWDQQQYKIRNGFQTIPATGPFPGVNSEYVATWQGPYVGLEGEMERGKHAFRMRGEYHALDYNAEAQWNLRGDLKQDPSFKHEGDGDGIRFEGEWGYMIDSRYEFYLTGMYENRTMENGLDTVFPSAGGVLFTRVNEVNDTSYGLHAGLRYNW